MFKLLKYLKKYTIPALLGPFFKITEAAFELIVPLIMTDIIDHAIPTGEVNEVLKKGIILVALSVTGYICSIICQYFASASSQGIGTEIRNALFKHIQSLSYKEIDTLGTPSLMTRMTNDITNVQQAVAMTIRLASRAPFIIIGATIMVIRINFQLALIFIVAAIFIALCIYWILSITLPSFKKGQKMLEKLALVTRENLEGARVIRAFSKEDYEIKRFNQRTQKQREITLYTGKFNALLNPITILIVNIAIILIIYQGGVKINTGRMSQGEIIAFISYMTQILQAIIAFSNTLVIINRGNASAKRINEIFETQNSLIEGTKTDLKSNQEGSKVSLKNVCFSYDANKDHFISNINVEIEPNETIGIIGVTGSGKSTLINLISRFYDVNEGEILIDDQNVKSYTFETLRKKIAIVPQNASLFYGTLRQNMQWQKEDATDQEIYEALEIAQALPFVQEFKEGLDTLIYQGGKNLSGGQRQRLTIARALVSKPSILILDDSASALDFATDASLRKAIYTHLKHTTVFLVSQRVNTIKNADKIIVLDEGKMMGVGSHQELLKHCDIYEQICRSQLSSKELDYE